MCSNWDCSRDIAQTLRGQATQYHQTLKTSALWAETARSEEFQRFLHVELSEDQVEVLNSPPKVVTTLPESLPRRISVPADVAETSLAHLRASLAVMERYGFLFPNEFHSTGLDQGADCAAEFGALTSTSPHLG
eukprot:g8490.t1